MKSLVKYFSRYVNLNGVLEKDKEKICSIAINTSFGILASFCFHLVSYFSFLPYPWFVFLYFFLYHAAMIASILLQPVELTYFAASFFGYAATLGPIWTHYYPSMLGSGVTAGSVIPIVILMTSRKKVLSLISLVVEFIKIAWIYPAIVIKNVENASREEILKLVDESFFFGALLAIFAFFVFYCFLLGIIGKEELVFKMKRQLENMNESLQNSLKERELFILSLSHEVRNPLNVVLGNIELCYEEATDPSLKERLKSAKICGDLLLSLINNVLDAGKAEMDNVEVCPTECAVVPLLEKIWSSCKEIIKNKGLKATISGLEGLPTFLKLDQHRLTQILFNLIGNAVKFTEKGEISLKISWRDTLTGNRDKYNETFDEASIEELPSYKEIKLFSPKLKPFLQSPPILPTTREREGILTLEISDTGYGISEEGIKGLFQKFAQASASNQQKKLGTGLGLWITKKICEKMNGEINVTSELGRSTTFSVKIRTTSSRLVHTTHSMPALTLGHVPSTSKRYSLMIVEDVVFNADIIARLIGECKGFDIVYRAENGLRAVEYYEKCIKEGKYLNVITMDIEMPVMDGKEACRRIRELERKYNINPCYIIIITGNCDDRALSECLNPSGTIQAQKFMRKPLKREDFTSQMISIYKSLHLDSKKDREKKKILVVDDDQFNVTLITGMLQKKKINVVSAKNGKEALEIYKENYQCIDIIFMDCEMGVMDGWTATQKIREFCKENQLKDPKIYGLTGYSDKVIEKKCLDSGMTEMIKKPISLYELTRRIS